MEDQILDTGTIQYPIVIQILEVSNIWILPVPGSSDVLLQSQTQHVTVLITRLPTGFTSMVPELSRSAEPLWNLRRTTPGPLPETPNSPISRYKSIAIANLH